LSGQVRTLPTDEDESRVLNSWWLSTNIDPQDANPDGGEPPLHCNASLLVNPYAELGDTPFDPPPMREELREDL
jgi:hypothetical protein